MELGMVSFLRCCLSILRVCTPHRSHHTYTFRPDFIWSPFEERTPSHLKIFVNRALFFRNHFSSKTCFGNEFVSVISKNDCAFPARGRKLGDIPLLEALHRESNTERHYKAQVMQYFHCLPVGCQSLTGGRNAIWIQAGEDDRNGASMSRVFVQRKHSRRQFSQCSMNTSSQFMTTTTSNLTLGNIAVAYFAIRLLEVHPTEALRSYVD